MIPPHLGSTGPTQLASSRGPRRAVAGINVRHEDKAAFDALQAWLSVEEGRVLTQWEAFELLLRDALRARRGALPAAVHRLLR